MGYSIDELTIRPAMDGDAEKVLGLMERCDLAEYGEPDTDLEDLLHSWGQIDLKKDTWIALRPTEEVVGYSAVLPWGSDARYEFFSDPDWPVLDLGRMMFTHCLERGPAFIRERSSSLETKINQARARIFIAHVNQRDQAIVKEAGFRPGKYYFQMRIELVSPVPEAQWPDDISVRTVQEGEDDQAIYEFIQDAFDQPGRTRPSFDQWHEHMERSDIFDPELWFLATAGQEMVGACLCFNYPSGGWVRQLGVAKEWRRQGIGQALLQHTFRVFQERGASNVGLTVESERPDAFRFYQAVGMRQVRQYDEYVRDVVV